KNRPQGDVTLDFLDSAGKLVNTYSSRAVEQPAPAAGEEEENPFRAAGPQRLPAQPGMNRFVWNLRYPDATSFPGMILWAGGITGPRVSPGTYQVRLAVDGKAQTQSFEVRKDQRIQTRP